MDIFNSELVTADVLVTAWPDIREPLITAVERFETSASLKRAWPHHLEKIERLASKKVSSCPSATPYNAEAEMQRALDIVYRQANFTAVIREQLFPGDKFPAGSTNVDELKREVFYNCASCKKWLKISGEAGPYNLVRHLEKHYLSPDGNQDSHAGRAKRRRQARKANPRPTDGMYLLLSSKAYRLSLAVQCSSIVESAVMQNAAPAVVVGFG